MSFLPDQFKFTHPHASSSSSSSSHLPPPGSHLIISDTPQASADFALYSLVGAAVREKKNVLVVDFQARGRGHWEAVGKKLGNPLPNKTSSSFTYLTPTSSPFTSSTSPTLFDEETDEPTLSPLWNSLIGQAQSSTLILLVGFSELLYQGFEPDELSRFIRGTLGWIRSSSHTLVTHIHTALLINPTSLTDHLADSPTSDAECDLLFRLLRVRQGVWWRIEELKSGRSGVVHGEISIHPLSGTDSVVQRRIASTNPLQYRLDDTSVKVFPKGMGKGYL